MSRERSEGHSEIVASLLRDRGVWLYGLATLLGAPVLLYRKWRLKRFLKLDSEFDAARWTMRYPPKLDAQPKHPSEAPGPRVMVFVPGWGDVKTMCPLLEELRRVRPDVRLLFTTKHYEAIGPASQLSDEPVSPLPFDNPFSVARWHEQARPDLMVFYERFWFATLLRSLWLRDVPFVIIHARMRRSPSRSALNVAFKKWQLRGLRAICIAAPQYEPGVAQLMHPQAQVHVVGSIKFGHARPVMAPEREAALRAWVQQGAGEAPLFVAGSTSPGEDEFVMEALQTVRRHCRQQNPVLLIAPRDPKRAPDIRQLAQARGLKVSLRSQGSNGRADVLLLDTMGELTTAYGWATGTLVGGTISGNSHNVAEPLVWGVPVAYGPRRGNFETEQRLCEAAGVGFRVESPDALAAHWTQLLQSPALREELKQKIEALNREQRPAFERTLQILVDSVDAVSQPPKTSR